MARQRRRAAAAMVGRGRGARVGGLQLLVGKDHGGILLLCLMRGVVKQVVFSPARTGQAVEPVKRGNVAAMAASCGQSRAWALDAN